jgi:hypothetical protein
MNFNEILINIYVYDDQLKTDSKNKDEGKYLLYRYKFSEKDIQKMDIDNIDINQYKMVYD